jgi:hypothetical protein
MHWAMNKKARQISWPSHSLDLNPLDPVLWGHLKNVMCYSAVDITEELLQHIQNVSTKFHITCGIFHLVCQSMHRWTKACVVVQDQYFENLL